MANVREYNDILSKLRKREFSPVYLLHGEEPFYIDRISKFIESNAIEEHERDFNLNIFYGRDLNQSELLETLKRFPMMAERQVVIIREAQDFKGKWTDLESYFEDPVSSTLLVIDFKYKKVDERLKWVKAAKKNGVVFNSSKHWENELPNVIESFAKELKYRITPHASFLMAEYLGNDLEKIEGELRKLTISIPLSQEIGENEVKKHIGISKEFSAFDYINALSTRDVERSYTIAYHIGRNDGNTPLVLVLSNMFSHFSKLMIFHHIKSQGSAETKNQLASLGSPFQLKKVAEAATQFNQRKTALIIEKLRETDARAKGVNSNSVSSIELLKELTFFILN
jgi:DNA polymerase III subunit delta